MASILRHCLVALSFTACIGRTGFDARSDDDVTAPPDCADDGIPAVVQFAVPAASTTEDSASVDIELTVARTKPFPIPVRLGYGGTATANDFQAETWMTVPACADRTTTTLTLVDDATTEQDETVRIAITAIDPAAAIGTRQVFSLLIRDDDSPAQTMFSELAVGAFHICGLLTDGTMLCWGNNDYGQLGDNTTTSSSIPVTVLSTEPLAQISASEHSTCAVAVSGALYCWGSNGYGHLGDNSYDDRHRPTLIDAGTSYRQVSTGYSSHGGVATCGVTTGDVLKCWGDNSYDQMGTPGEWGSLVPIVVDAGVSYEKVVSGGQIGCALTTSRVLKCWGTSWTVGLGLGASVVYDRPMDIDAGTTYLDVDVGEDHICGVALGGVLKCWSGNHWGQLGLGDTEDREFPTIVDASSTYASVATGEYHTCAIATDGALKCWGTNDFGELGTGSNDASLLPTGIEPGIPYARIWAKRHWTGGSSNGITCGSTAAGDARCWGDNSESQLQHPSLSVTATRALLSGVVTTTNTCAIDADRALYCWGEQPHLGADWRRMAPVQIHPQTQFARLPAQSWSLTSDMCAIADGDQLVCWGENATGVLGDGTTASRWTPAPVLPGVAVDQISLGTDHACALTTNGKLYCWGDNTTGELGDNTTEPRLTPVAIDSASDYVAVAAGSGFTCAIALGGELRCWGANSLGQLGDGGTTERHVPAPVSGSAIWSAVAAGSAHACAVDADSTISCWGSRLLGRTGNGSTSGTSTAPTPISSSDTYATLAVSGSTTCAITTGDVAHCWGRNLPTGTTTIATTPQIIDAGTSYVTATGGDSSCGLTTDGELRCWGAAEGRGDGWDNRWPDFVLPVQ